MNYVALYLPKALGGGIYGVAKCETTDDALRVIQFADERGIDAITGDLHEPDDLMEKARIMRLGNPSG